MVTHSLRVTPGASLTFVCINVNTGFGVRMNVGRLLEAFGLVRRAHNQASLLLVAQGYGPGDEAHVWAVRRDLTQNVEFLGPWSNSDSMELIRATDVLVHPSLEESFGHTLIESIGVGTPVIGGERSGAVPWVLANGRAGVLTDVTNSGALAKAMSGLVTDAQRWDGLRRQGYEIARARFSASVVADRYAQALRELIQ